MKYIPYNFYHVYNRGAHKQNIFFEPDNYQYLVTLFNKYRLQYKITIVAYCLMPNHYHLILKQFENGSIGQFLKTVFTAYTQAINKRFCLSGTLFQGQAKVKFIDSDEYCLHVIRYIHLNPVSAGFVLNPEEWEYSNYREWVGLKESFLIDLKLQSSFFKSGLEYSIFVKEYEKNRENSIITKYVFNEE